ncbi:MAG: hypothetical protein IPG63_18140 [Xanthomonadales bacterium]|nr:hypothetical protein [Xanthomonadales bacterium]
MTIDLQANVDRIENNTLDDASVHAALVAAGLPAMSPNDEWSLDALVVAAWQFRPELAEARALRSAAAADVDATKSRPSPLVSLIPELVLMRRAAVPDDCGGDVVHRREPVSARSTGRSGIRRSATYDLATGQSGLADRE